MDLPSAARGMLDVLCRQMQAGEVRRVNLTPLSLRAPLQSVLARRARLFSSFAPEGSEFSYRVRFSHALRPTERTPDGRTVDGEFWAVEVSRNLAILMSGLSSEAEAYGSGLLAQRAYPLAVRPFLRSTELLQLVAHLASERNWAAVSADAMGYDRQTREFRRDMKHQPVADAFREMEEQGRQVHRMRVAFRTPDGRIPLNVTFDRYATAVVHSGDARVVLAELVQKAVDQTRMRSRALSVRRSRNAANQKVVRLRFPGGTFAHLDDMDALCEALRCGDGVNVTVLHLNPYLHAQVLDYYAGQALDMLVLDDACVSLLPRSAATGVTMQRVVATVFRYFGEADVTVETVARGGNGVGQAS